MPFYNRGKRGQRLEGQPLVLGPGSYIDPVQGGPFLFEDFLSLVTVVASNVGGGPHVLINSSGDDTTPATINAAAGAPVAGHGGWIAGATDNVDGEIDEIALGRAPWLVPAALPAGGLIIAEAGLVIATALTDRMYFFGLGDAATGGADDDGMISIVTGVTLVSGATGDAAGFVFSTLATDVDNWYTGNILATVVGTAYNTSAGTQGPAMAASTTDDYTRLRVEVDVAGNCYFYAGISTTLGRDAVPLEYRSSVAAGVTASVPFMPIHSAASTTTTAVPYELDYIFGAATHA